MSRVFINYRRLDSAPYAGRLYDRLIHDLGRDFVFMDIDKIDPGDDWVEVIEQRLEACAAVIVLIGPSWIDCTDKSGERRLDNPDDHVRRELAVALQRKVRVVPVLVGGASMPRSDRLPTELALLVRRNAIELSDQRFHHDVDRLVEVLSRLQDNAQAAGPAPISTTPAANFPLPADRPTHDLVVAKTQSDEPSPRSFPAERAGSTPIQAPVPEPSLPKAAAGVSIAHTTVELSPGPDLRGHQKPVMSVAFSLDGSLLASAGGGDFFGTDTAIRLWSLPKSKLLREIPGHKHQVTSVAFSPDGKTLASCSAEALRIWRVADGKHLQTIEEDYGESVEFSSDGTLLLSGAGLYRLPDGELVRKLGGDENTSFALCPDAKHFVCMTGKLWKICRIDDGKPVLDVPLKPNIEYPHIALSADGRLLAAVWHHDRTNWVALFETSAGKRLWERHTDGAVVSLRFHPGGTVLAFGNQSGEELVLWHLADGEIAARVKMPNMMLSINEVQGVAFSADGKQVAAACRDAVVRLWTVAFS